MLDSHLRAAEESAYVGTEAVPCLALDSAAAEYLQDAREYFVKIDTQGYEWQVLKGGMNTVRGAAAIQCELSFTPLYSGQRLWRDIVDLLESEGFTLWNIEPMFVDQNVGRTLQVDALFVREGH
jgi:hypothetical protein